MGEPERDETSSGVRLVPNQVLRLLGSGAVIGETISLDDQPEIRPVEVDLVSVHPLPGQRHRVAGSDRDRYEEPLELRAGQAEGTPVERRDHARRAGSMR